MKAVIKYFYIAIAAVGITTATATAAEAQEETVVKWGHVSDLAYYWDVYAAMENGYFAKRGIKVEPVRVHTVVQSVQLLVTGAADILSTLPDVAMTAADKGASIAIVGAEVTKTPWVLTARPEIKSYADLKGKTVGVAQINEGTTAMLRLLLAKHGLSDKDITLVQSGGTSQRYAALVSGGISAGLLGQPADFRAKANGMTMLGQLSEAFQGPAIAFVVRKEWAAKNRRVVQDFLTAAQEGAKWLYDPQNKEKAIALLEKKTKARGEDARLTYEMYIEQEKLISRDGSLPLAHIANYIGLTSYKNTNPEYFVDMSFVGKQ